MLAGRDVPDHFQLAATKFRVAEDILQNFCESICHRKCLCSQAREVTAALEINKEPQMTESSPPRHVFVWRTFRGVPFQHHGICLGDGTVVHFTDGEGGIAGPGGDWEQFRICRTEMAAFARQGECFIHEVSHRQRLDDAQIRRRALRCLGRAGVVGTRYHLTNHNCEHFARWCVTGELESRQVTVCVQRASSAGAKALLSAAGRWGVRGVAVKSRLATGLVRGCSPWLLTADAVQWTTEALGQHVGLVDEPKRKLAGQILGGTAAAAVGLSGGVVGMLAATGFWVAGESAAWGVRQIGKR